MALIMVGLGPATALRAGVTMVLSSEKAVPAVAPALPKFTTLEGPTFSKALSTPDPVPVEGQERALALMKSGALFRYTPGILSETALAEEAMCKPALRYSQ